MSKQVGKRYSFRDQEMWAENGLVYILDYRDSCPEEERFKCESASEFAARAIALNEECPSIPYPGERWEINSLVEKMCQIVKETRRQGRPDDPEAAKQKAYDNRKLIFLNNFNANRSRLYTPFNYESPTPPLLADLTPPDAPLVNRDSE